VIRDTAERGLVAAILRQAIDDCGSFDFRVQREARDWVMYDGIEPMSYQWCCSYLDLPPNVARAKIIRAADARQPRKLRRWFGQVLAA
jgi:hypothetical protein